MTSKRRATRRPQNRLDFRELEPRQLLAALSNGQEIVSSIGVGGSESFDFEVALGQRVDVSVGEISGSGEPRLTILDPNGSEMGTNSNGSNAAALVFTATQGGTYTAVVTDDGQSESVGFRIRALTSPGATELIPGRDQSLSSGEEARAVVPIGGFNLFPFDVSFGQRVDVSVGETSGSGEPRLTILGPNGSELDTNSNNSNAAALVFTATQSGTYTAVVTDDGRSESVGFRIRALTTPGSLELIPGRDQSLSSGEEARAVVPVGGFNLFPFEVSVGQRVDVSVGETSGSGEPRLTILGPNGYEFDTNSNNSNAAALVFTATQSGTYTAVVTDDGRSESVGFRIRALTTPGALELIPGREQALADGEEASATVPVGGFNLFPFEVNAGQRVDVSVQETGGSGEPFLRLLGPGGTSLGFDTTSAGAALSFTATESGIYSAVVTDSGRDEGVAFRITATGISQLAPGVIRFNRDGQDTRNPELFIRQDLLDGIEVGFNQNVEITSDDFTFFNETTGSEVQILPQSTLETFEYDPANFIASWDFSQLRPTLFPAGFYTVSATGVTATSNNRPLAGGFSEQVLVALPGDANLDGTVDVLGDAAVLVNNLGAFEAARWTQGDFNNDGMVDVLGDAAILVNNLGGNVNPIAISARARTLPVNVAVDEGELPTDPKYRSAVATTGASLLELSGTQILGVSPAADVQRGPDEDDQGEAGWSLDELFATEEIGLEFV